jgi:hypothetical protein
MAGLTGCFSLSVPGGFSPVEGPLSEQSPTPPTYIATLSSVLSGTISVVPANGEVCAGPWHFVSKTAPVNTDSPAAADVPTDIARDNKVNIFEVSVYN